MDVNFSHTAPDKVEPIYIEQVFAEKPGGGIIENTAHSLLPTTAVGEKDGKFAPIKAYRLVGAVVVADTKIKIAKDSGVAVGDIIAHGTKGVACTAVDTTHSDYDEVTVTLGVEIPNDTVLYQAKAASTDKAEPILIPAYVTGNYVPGNKGDFPVRLLNGANLRKETANVAREVAAMLPMITLV